MPLQLYCMHSSLARPLALGPAAAARTGLRGARLPFVRKLQIGGQQQQQQQQPLPLRGDLVTVRASSSGSGDEATDAIPSAALWVLWAGLVAYGVFLSPNLTPLRDSYFLEKLVGLGENDGVKINQIFVALFNIMGVIPGIYASLLIPSARSANKIPAWPFIGASFFLGAFALVPYMALWKPDPEVVSPPPKSELEGFKGFFVKGLESPYGPYGLLAATLYQFYMVGTATGADWVAYGHLLDESRFAHVTTLDFLCLTTLLPFWMNNDATQRKWDKSNLIPVLSCLPVLGPVIYLVIRPKAEQ